MTTLQDATEFLIGFLRDPRRNDYGTYGSEFSLTGVLMAFGQERLGVPNHETIHHQKIVVVSPLFFEAVWNLQRKGYLRPGAVNSNAHTTSDTFKWGFCLTEAGRRWLQNAEDEFFIPSDMTRLSQIIDRFGEVFGSGFLQRAHEASQCYSCNLYYGACSMVGAAAESILLRIAEEKMGNSGDVLDTYNRAGGRSNLIKMIIGQLPKQTAEKFSGLMDLINYRRDEASHGRAVDISEFDAYDALSRLLRLAHFVQDHWAEFARKAAAKRNN